MTTVHRKIWQGKNIGEFGKLWEKIFVANIHRYRKNVFDIHTDCSSLFAKFFLANSFYLYGLPKSSPAKYSYVR